MRQWRNFKFWAPPQGNQLGPPLPHPDDPAYHCNLPPQHQHSGPCLYTQSVNHNEDKRPRVHATCCVKKLLPEFWAP